VKDRCFITEIPDLKSGDPVIVNAERGEELGWIRGEPYFMPASAPNLPKREIIRQAETKDVERVRRMKNRARDAMATCEECITTQNLPMTLIDAAYAYDGSKLTFFFTSETRVDFRKLVRDLAHIFRTRIELRQIGVRDEARKIGGVGPCGRVSCCSNFLSEFAPVSIRMAKNQGLNLSPTKISGLCGRLMCCLNYEEKYYKCRIREFPKVGQRFSIDDTEYSVCSSNMLLDMVWLSTSDNRSLKISLEEFKKTAKQVAKNKSRPKGKEGQTETRSASRTKPDSTRTRDNRDEAQLKQIDDAPTCNGACACAQARGESAPADGQTAPLPGDETKT